MATLRLRQTHGFLLSLYRCLAMEDAFVVAHLMKKHGLSSAKSASQEQLQAVCKEYQEQRGKRVGDTVLRARKRAAITHALEGMEQTNEWYTELAKEDGFHIMEGAFFTTFAFFGRGLIFGPCTYHVLSYRHVKDDLRSS